MIPNVYSTSGGVASFSEAWIEIVCVIPARLSVLVASFSEAWIEIKDALYICDADGVASFSEAWIEIVL